MRRASGRSACQVMADWCDHLQSATSPGKGLSECGRTCNVNTWACARRSSPCVCVLGFTSTSAGQDPRGAIQGRVVDSSGGALPGTTVTVTNTATGTVEHRGHRRGGPLLHPVHHAGQLRRHGRTHRLQARRAEGRRGAHRRPPRRSTSRLEVGGLEETITVEGGTPLLETRSASQGQVIDEKRIQLMPLSDGNPFTLTRLAAGTVYTGDLKFSRPFDNARHLGRHVQRRGRRQRVHAGRLAQHGQRPARGLRAPGRRRAGVQGRDRDVRRAAGPHGRRDRQRDDEERHEHVPRRRLLPHPRREVQQERLLPRAGRPAEGRARLQAVRLHGRRPGGPRLLQRAQQDVLLHGRRVAVRHVPGARPVHGADRGAAQRRLLGAAAARHPDLRPGHRAARERPGPPHRVPRQHHPGQPHQPGGARDDEVLPAAQPGRQRAGPEQLPEHERARRRLLLVQRPRRSPVQQQQQDVRALLAQQPHGVPRQLDGRAERHHPDGQLPVPHQRRRHR